MHNAKFYRIYEKKSQNIKRFTRFSLHSATQQNSQNTLTALDGLQI